MSSTQQLLDPNSVNANIIGPSSANQLSSSVGLLCSSGVLPELSDLPLRSSSRSSSIGSGSVTQGTLDSTDLTNLTRAGTFRDDYLLTSLVVGQQVQVNLNSSTFDTYLQVINAETGEALEFDDNSGRGSNAQATFTVADGIDYIVRTTSSNSDVTDNYTLRTSTGVAIPGTPISGNESISGTLVSTDPSNPTRTGTYSDDYLLTGLNAGQQVLVNLDSTAFDTYLQLVNADTGAVVTYDDDSGSGLNSQLNFTAPDGIDYILRATSYGTGITGNYTLTTTTTTPTPTPTSTSTPGTPADWTFMVYLDGDNNLENFAIGDFLEMASIGSTSNVNVVVQFDRANGYGSSYGNWRDTRRGLVQVGDVPNASWGTSIGEVNMGAQSTLTDFVDWSMTNYQANNYALVLWDHGGGWNYIASDNSSSGDYLTANEVSGALSSLPDNLDLIGADACLMSMIEFAYQVSDIASVLVGSEQLEPGDGWTYDTIVSDLTTNPDWTAAQLGTAIVDRYEEFYNSSFSAETLSAIDLSVVNSSLSTAISDFATTLMNDATSYDLSQLTTYRSDAAYYEYSYFRDLGTILSSVASDTTMTSSITTAAQTALSAYNSAIIANFSATGQNATGLSIYFQAAGSSVASDYDSSQSAFAADTAWDDFLNLWAV